MRTILSVVLSVVVAVSLFPSHGYAAAPLGVRIVEFRTVAPGRVRVDAAVTGLRPEMQLLLQGAVTLGHEVVDLPAVPVIASRIPIVIDLRAGTGQVDGVSGLEFRPVPPLDSNLPIAIELTVRQGSEGAAARLTGLLLLPTVIVPGYLNEFGVARPDGAVISGLEQRGYRAGGPWPNLFWFRYRSRSLSVQEAARALATYVHAVVLPASYAARINVVGYSLGGLVARWDIAFAPDWEDLVDRFVMVGVPNEGAVMSYVDAWYPVVGLARTPAARGLLPTFPFWRPRADARWELPSDGRNPVLDELNARPLPDGVRVYAFYGDRTTDSAAPGTWAGVTGTLPKAGFSYGAGDGIVLTASALGLPINGGSGIPGLADRLRRTVNLGAVRHQGLLEAAIPDVADALRDDAPGEEPSIMTHRADRAQAPQDVARHDGERSSTGCVCFGVREAVRRAPTTGRTPR
ncbi:MAG TPA: hypothetical protein VKZ50_08340 [bacterium]|nr:hypothetical protein [bacterium]